MRRLISCFVALVMFAYPALAACPTAETVNGRLCKVGSDLARELVRDMPVELESMSLDIAVSTIAGIMIIAQPTSANGTPEPNDAVAYLCEYESVQAFVEAGGTIDIRMLGKPFFVLSGCEAP